MLTSFSLPSKNLTQEKQLALMRNYLNQLKDETETELYDIKWDNLAKSLKDKIDGLDRELVATNDNLGQLRANTVTTNYLTSQFIYTGTLQAEQIKTGTIDTARIDVATIRAGCVNADLFQGDYIKANYIDAATIRAGCVNADLFQGDYIKADYIDAGTIRAGLMVASDFTATNIAGKFVAANTTVFNRINLGTLPYNNSNSSLRINVGGTYANVYLKATSTAHQYYLVVNMPD